MSIQKESYYRLVKISELSSVNRNSFIQLVGSITSVDEENKKIVIDDSFAKHTIELGSGIEQTYKPGQVVKVFGNWDGIKLSVSKILQWIIPSEKVPILFKEY